MDIKGVLEYNIKTFNDQLNIELLSGNVAKQEFYRGAIYALNGLLNHDCLRNEPRKCAHVKDCPEAEHKCYTAEEWCDCWESSGYTSNQEGGENETLDS